MHANGEKKSKEIHIISTAPQHHAVCYVLCITAKILFYALITQSRVNFSHLIHVNMNAVSLCFSLGFSLVWGRRRNNNSLRGAVRNPAYSYSQRHRWCVAGELILACTRFLKSHPPARFLEEQFVIFRTLWRYREAFTPSMIKKKKVCLIGMILSKDPFSI